MPSCTSSAGPDGVTGKSFRTLPWEAIVKLCNLFLLLERPVLFFMNASTVLIPKKAVLGSPGDLWHITVCNILARVFHKVIAARMTEVFHFDARQSGFRELDGCTEYSVMLKLILNLRRAELKLVFMTSVDLA